MFDFQIRRATQHDFAVIMRLTRALLAEMYALNHQALCHDSEAWLDFESRIWQTLSCGEGSAHRDGDAVRFLEIADLIGREEMPIGFIETSILCPVPVYRPARTLCIHAVYVLPRYRRRGVGTALLRSALEWGQQHQCGWAQLSVLPHNPARRLYRALGFSGCGLEMRKELLHPAPSMT